MKWFSSFSSSFFPEISFSSPLDWSGIIASELLIILLLGQPKYFNKELLPSSSCSFHFLSPVYDTRRVLSKDMAKTHDSRERIKRSNGIVKNGHSRKVSVQLQIIAGLDMNSMKLVIPLHSLYWSIHTKDESKRGTAFAFIFGVN